MQEISGSFNKWYEFPSRKIKEVGWDDGICYQCFLAYKTVSNTGQEQKGEYRYTYGTLQVQFQTTIIQTVLQ